MVLLTRRYVASTHGDHTVRVSSFPEGRVLQVRGVGMEMGMGMGAGQGRAGQGRAGQGRTGRDPFLAPMMRSMLPTPTLRLRGVAGLNLMLNPVCEIV